MLTFAAQLRKINVPAHGPAGCTMSCPAGMVLDPIMKSNGTRDWSLVSVCI
jgi:hypothetical protein